MNMPKVTNNAIKYFSKSNLKTGTLSEPEIDPRQRSQSTH
jgi:hypothetical protein